MAEPIDKQVHLLLPASMREAVRKWRFANEVESESEALRRLIQRGLDAEAADRKPRKG